ncbi:VP7 [Bombyx mori cypovirus 1]|uniref:VP7 n=1 Tax=Bombyx mori cytoplasmic polyhedrosis virus TaxID=110829 RepID=A0A0P0QLP2_CPVBM|nr:VP7 [Bombyx mori cypovirus 1]
MLQQPTGGYTTLEQFAFTIRNDGTNATPTQFLQLLSYEATENELVKKTIPTPETHLPSARNVPGNVYIEDAITQALFGISAQNVNAHGYFSRLSALALPNTSARLGLDGVIYNSETINIPFYDPAAVANFAATYAKLGNASTPRYRADMIDIYAHVGLELAGTDAERAAGVMPVKRAKFDSWEGSLISLSRDVVNWKILAFLIDLCSLEGEALRAFKTRNRDVFRMMLFIMSTAVAANVVNRKVTKRVDRVIEYIGVNSMRTAGRTATITYDLSRHEFAAKFLQLTFTRWNAASAMIRSMPDMHTPRTSITSAGENALVRHNRYMTENFKGLSPIALAQKKHEMMLHTHEIHSMDIDGSIKNMVERETVNKMNEIDAMNTAPWTEEFAEVEPTTVYERHQISTDPEQTQLISQDAAVIVHQASSDVDENEYGNSVSELTIDTQSDSVL